MGSLVPILLQVFAVKPFIFDSHQLLFDAEAGQIDGEQTLR